MDSVSRLFDRLILFLIGILVSILTIIVILLFGLNSVLGYLEKKVALESILDNQDVVQLHVSKVDTMIESCLNSKILLQAWQAIPEDAKLSRKEINSARRQLSSITLESAKCGSVQALKGIQNNDEAMTKDGMTAMGKFIFITGRLAKYPFTEDDKEILCIVSSPVNLSMGAEEYLSMARQNYTPLEQMMVALEKHILLSALVADKRG